MEELPLRDALFTLAVDDVVELPGSVVGFMVDVTVETPIVVTTVVDPFALTVAVIGQMVV